MLNIKRLSKLIMLLAIIPMLIFGVLHLKHKYKEFTFSYLHERNVEHIEAKYGKPYLVWQQEERDKCLALAFKEGGGLLNPHADEAKPGTGRDRDCSGNETEILISSTDIMSAYLWRNALFIALYIFGAILLSWLFGFLLTRAIPSTFSLVKRWLTTMD